MSEERNLNESSPDPDTTEMEGLLRSLAPRPLALNRDRLFFEAGRAAARGRSGRIFWPAIAASLMIVCAGLGVALQRQSKTLAAALAAVASQPTEAVAVDADAPRAVGPAPKTVATIISNAPDQQKQFDSPSRPDRMQQVLSLEPRPRGQLTMHGWIDAPPGSRASQFESIPVDASESPTRPIQRPTYLELIRAEQG